jgi:hypothetical protein
MAITSRNDTRDNTRGRRRMLGERRAGTRGHSSLEHSSPTGIRHSKQERSRSCTLGHSHRNNLARSRHNSRNQAHTRRHLMLCHRPQQLPLIQPRVLGPSPSHHLAKPELVMGPPRP